MEGDKLNDFPIENLPYGVFTSPVNETEKHIGVAYGEFVLDLNQISHYFDGPLLKDKQHVFKQESLNAFMGLTKAHWLEARETIQRLIKDNTIKNATDVKRPFIELKSVTMHLPVHIGDYTDFYSSIQHATNVGIMFRSKENALMPNWKHLPVGYHGRSSSIVVSGTPIRRPYGQTLPVEGAAPHFGPCRLMDFELEMGCFVGGPPTALGQRVTAKEAEDRIFGFVLLNDWSARDIQKWEYVPLGPFTAKNLGTTISPWIVTVEALRPFIVDNYPQDPAPFPYLQHNDKFNFDVKLEVDLKPEKSLTYTTISRSNFRHMYWTVKQQLAQQTITGCNLNPGDLLGSGTISGDTPDSYGSMLELSWKGTKPLRLLNGEERKFLQDGDTVVLRGYCDNGSLRIGFGTCEGKLLPALPFEE
ncbi:fumarylacetoacetate hydrolase [Choristoneura fumiferana]|uniref:fumarylacetoacetate hydrolase n=1 Tax=Choristoneura fumiferana TaxID=7141 RepID=UPI003D15D1A4